MIAKKFQNTIAYSQGMTLLELIVVVAIVGLLAAVAVPNYQQYVEDLKVNEAIQDIAKLSLKIEKYVLINVVLPNSLADIGEAGIKDPWDKTYAYYNVRENGKGGARKDKNLTPINSDYDLYSFGDDGASAKPLTAKRSHDDVIRASNGGFIGLGEDY